MNAPRPAGLALLALIVTASCEAPEPAMMPVILPPAPEVQRQAETGEAAAQFALAQYHLGDEDPAVMLRWLRASACQGDPLAQVSLGVLYDAGDRVYQDRIEAYLWFSWAAQQGNSEAAQFAVDLKTAMANDERAFAETLLQDGWLAMLDCRTQ